MLVVADTVAVVVNNIVEILIAIIVMYILIAMDAPKTKKNEQWGRRWIEESSKMVMVEKNTTSQSSNTILNLNEIERKWFSLNVWIPQLNFYISNIYWIYEG